MTRIPMIVRKEKEGNLIAFFPGESANYGMIECFDGCHDEASIEYYHTTKKVSKEEADSFIGRYASNLGRYCPEFEFYRMERLTYALQKKAWGRI